MRNYADVHSVQFIQEATTSVMLLSSLARLLPVVSSSPRLSELQCPNAGRASTYVTTVPQNAVIMPDPD